MEFVVAITMSDFIRYLTHYSISFSAPSSPFVYYLFPVCHGFGYYQTGHWRSVVEYCTRALELNKRYVKALTRRLKAYDALEMRHDALLGKEWEGGGFFDGEEIWEVKDDT